MWSRKTYQGVTLHRLVDMTLMSSRFTVDLGDRFRKMSKGSGVWIVVGFAADHAGNPHARLAMESDRTRTITIAVTALQNRKSYERLVGSSGIPGVADDGFIG